MIHSITLMEMNVYHFQWLTGKNQIHVYKNGSDWLKTKQNFIDIWRTNPLQFIGYRLYEKIVRAPSTESSDTGWSFNSKPSEKSQSGRRLWRWMLALTRGLDSECCGEERTSTGTPRAGLVPEPLLPANWPRSRWQGENEKDRKKEDRVVI